MHDSHNIHSDSIPSQTDLNAEEGEEIKSKSQIKREMTALQDFGLRLTQLNKQQLDAIELNETLLKAIREYNSLKKNEAKRRQLQYIGKIMRNVDAEPIIHALNLLDSGHKENVQHFHNIERWRDLLLGDPKQTTQFLEQFSQANPQHLRQLLRNTKKEMASNKNSGHGRKLFRYLKEVMDSNAF